MARRPWVSQAVGLVELIDGRQELIGRDQVTHRLAIARKTHLTLPIDDHQRRHAAQLQETTLLTEGIGYPVLRIRQADERQLVALPIAGKTRGVLWANDDDLGAAGLDLGVAQAQLRHVLAAVWSSEAAIENQHYVLAAPEVR